MEPNRSGYSPAVGAGAPPAPAPEVQPLVQWKASEFIDHQKDASWFIPLAFGSVAVSLGVYFVTKDLLSAIVILLAGAAFGVYGHQKPRTISYALLPTSIKVGAKTYSYNEFLTFSIVQEGALFSIFLQPIKRFLPPLSIYFPPEHGELIFDTLANHLPHQERQPDFLERLMRKIRF